MKKPDLVRAPGKSMGAEPINLLNRHSHVPYYKQIVHILTEEIGEDYEDGAKLPSEAALSRRFEVNRLTVRKAVEELNHLGLVKTLHGKGTFASKAPMRYEISTDQKASFTRTMQDLGHIVETQAIDRMLVNDPEIRGQLKAEAPLLRTDILRLVDGTPWSLTSTWLAPEHFPGIADQWSGNESLYQVMAEHFGVEMLRANRSFASLPSDARDSEWLMIPIAIPMLQVKGLNVDVDRNPVSWVVHNYPGDRVQFTMEVE